jgi:hypothetical protein
MQLIMDGAAAIFKGSANSGQDGIGAIAMCPKMPKDSGIYSIEIKLSFDPPVSAEKGTPNFGSLDPGTRLGIVSGAVNLQHTLGRSGYSWGWAADGDIWHGEKWIGRGNSLLSHFVRGDTVKMELNTHNGTAIFYRNGNKLKGVIKGVPGDAHFAVGAYDQVGVGFNIVGSLVRAVEQVAGQCEGDKEVQAPEQHNPVLAEKRCNKAFRIGFRMACNHACALHSDIDACFSACDDHTPMDWQGKKTCLIDGAEVPQPSVPLLIAACNTVACTEEKEGGYQSACNAGFALGVQEYTAVPGGTGGSRATKRRRGQQQPQQQPRAA